MEDGYVLKNIKLNKSIKSQSNHNQITIKSQLNYN